jgi:D-aspartate ligase
MVAGGRLSGRTFSRSGVVRHCVVVGGGMTRQAASTPADTGAIVIGRDYGALGVIRSLGRHGIPVWHLEESASNATVSRFVSRRLPWPADDTEETRLGYLLDLDRTHGLAGWTVYPVDDEAAALVARHHDALGGRFLLTTPPWEALLWAYDKRLTHQLAAATGVAFPWTRIPRDRAELATLDFPFPVILKPAVKPEWNRLTTAKAWRVDERDALIARYDEAIAVVAPESIMIQELIPGGGESQFSFAALCEDGRPLAWAVARRVRQLPLDFGRFSTYVETIDHPAVEEASRRLLTAIGYTGLIELEYKQDPRTGDYKLLDLNGRIWAWHTLGRRAGVDFPYLQWQLAHGEAIPETRARSGVRWMRGLTDFPAAAKAIRQGTLGPLAYLGSYRPPLEFAIFAVDDPLPALVDAPLMLQRNLSRFWARRRQPVAGAALGGASAFRGFWR